MSQTTVSDMWHVTSRNPVTGKKLVFTKRLPVLLKKRFNIPTTVLDQSDDTPYSATLLYLNASAV